MVFLGLQNGGNSPLNDLKDWSQRLSLNVLK
jgi:hypothetical protein